MSGPGAGPASHSPGPRTLRISKNCCEKAEATADLDQRVELLELADRECGSQLPTETCWSARIFQSVTNLDESLDWHKKVFKVEAIDYKFAHRYRENTGNNHKGFLESRTGLGHIAFLIDEHSDLEAWMARLEN
ncbi:hypothetical protein [Streptomyces sp. NPDC001020]